MIPRLVAGILAMVTALPEAAGAQDIVLSPAAEGGHDLPLGTLFLLALAIGVWLARYTALPSLVWPLLAAVILGPTCLGRLAPDFHDSLLSAHAPFWGPLDNTAQLALVVVLLEAGFMVKLEAARRELRTALAVGIVGVVVPFALVAAFWLAAHSWLPADLLTGSQTNWTVFAIYRGLASSISAMVVIVLVLKERGLEESVLGLRIVVAFAVNDLLCWIGFSIVHDLAARGTVDLASAALPLCASLVFTALAIRLGVPMANAALAYCAKTTHRQNLVPLGVLGTTYLLGALCEAVHLSALLGYFLAGMMLGQSRAHSGRIEEFLRQVVMFLVPVYFFAVGLKYDFLGAFSLPLVVLACLHGVVGKLFGAWGGAWLAGHRRADRWPLSIAFIVSGVPTLFVAEDAVALGVFSEPVLVADVFAVVLSTMILGPWFDRARRPERIDVAACFRPTLMVPTLHRPERDGAIAELARVAAEGTGIAPEVILRAALEREAEASTAIGEDVAIPHCTLDGLGETLIAVGRSPGIDWPGAPKGHPVTLVFLILFVPGDERDHAYIQSQVAKAIVQAKLHDQLVHDVSADDMHVTATRALRAG